MPTKKLITLSSEDIAGKLDAEENMSAVVEAVLARHYGLAIEGEGAHIDKRREVFDTLEDTPVSFVEDVPAAEPDLGNDLIQEEVPAFEPVIIEQPVENPVENPVEEAVDNPAEELPVYEEESVQPVGVSDPETGEPIVDNPAEEAPAVEEVAAEELAVEPVEEPAAEEPPINVLGQAGGQCEIHGLHVGSICIECL